MRFKLRARRGRVRMNHDRWRPGYRSLFTVSILVFSLLAMCSAELACDLHLLEVILLNHDLLRTEQLRVHLIVVH
jgi:hypothetical protein